MVYLWTEDSGAGFHFWKLLNLQCFDGQICVETKYSNEGIVAALTNLDSDNIPIDDYYIIAFDCVFDNVDIFNKFLRIHAIKSKHPDNIFLLDIICFEYLILQFEQLQDWTGNHKPDLFNVRNHLLNNIHGHKISRNAIEDMRTLNYLSTFKNTRSTEYIIKAITRDLTSTDAWNVDGEFLGECWWKNCCVAKTSHILCGNPPESAKEKLNSLFSSHSVEEIVKIINVICSRNSSYAINNENSPKQINL